MVPLALWSLQVCYQSLLVAQPLVQVPLLATLPQVLHPVALLDTQFLEQVVLVHLLLLKYLHRVVLPPLEPHPRLQVHIRLVLPLVAFSVLRTYYFFQAIHSG